MTAGTQTYEFRAEIQELLNILVHYLYTDREIFLRELVRRFGLVAEQIAHRAVVLTMGKAAQSSPGPRRSQRSRERQ